MISQVWPFVQLPELEKQIGQFGFKKKRRADLMISQVWPFVQLPEVAKQITQFGFLKS